MKFTLIDQKHNKDTFEQISSDDEESVIVSTKAGQKKSRLDKLVNDLKPIIINAPPIHILVQQTPVRRQTVSQIVTVDESSDEDLYVIGTPLPARNKQILDVQSQKPELKVETCTICLLDIKKPGGKIHCGHMFCGQCIIQSSNVSNKCPNCRARFKQITIGSKVIKVKNKTLQEDMFDFDDEPCYMCGRNDRPDELLVCDHCEFAFCHVNCDNRLNSQFPENDWFCHDCTYNERHIS